MKNCLISTGIKLHQLQSVKAQNFLEWTHFVVVYGKLVALVDAGLMGESLGCFCFYWHKNFTCGDLDEPAISS